VPPRSGMIASLVVLTLAVAACGGSTGASDAKGTHTAGAGTTGVAGATAAAPPTSGTATAPTGDVAEIKVEIRDGRVIPRPSVHKVARGRTVRILVTCDENDELHVHGYDLELELKPGTTATAEFTADEAGRFEVETHESGLQLLQLQVS
jgi:hypothetical protein